MQSAPAHAMVRVAPAPQQPNLPMQAGPPVLRTRVIDRVDPVGAIWGHMNATEKAMLALHAGILLAVSYHGYKRNSNSVPWGLSWALGGLVCPTVTMGFALSQGYAKQGG